MVENNPLSLLLAEYYQRYSQKGACQFLLNIGSGSRSLAALREPSREGGGVLGALVWAYKTSAIRRIASAYDWLLGGLSWWEKYTRSIDNASELRDRCTRLDVSLGAAEPRLDDTQAIPGLKDRVRLDAELLSEIDKMADRIVASLFYFELGGMPAQDGTTFRGSGRILCLRKGGDPALDLLVEKFAAANARFVVNGKVLAGNSPAPYCWEPGGDFVVPLQYYHTLGPELSISMAWGDGRSYPISGSPYSIHRLVRDQGLNAYFGLPDHRRRHRALPQRGATDPMIRCNRSRELTGKRRPTTQPGAGGSQKRRRLWWASSR